MQFLSASKVSASKVKKMFSEISSHYDLANRVITFGRDQVWRSELVNLSGVKKGDQILDCGTGTGMLAFCFLKKLGKQSHIVGIDFCIKMLQQAQNNLENLQKKSKINGSISFKQADIHHIPYSDNTFDVSVMSYGLRNTENPHCVLKEMARVTKPGGQVLILETGKTSLLFFKPFFDFYLRFVMPILGGLITGKKSAYRYLQKSSFNFPSGISFLQFMQSIKRQEHPCFKNLTYKTLCFGASFIYKAQVL